MALDENMLSVETPSYYKPRGVFPLLGIALTALLVLLAVTRFYRLDHQAYHHDESIHCYYSWKIAKDGFQSYQYDPVYHGPFLYHFGSLFQRVLPDTDWMARVPFALVGVLGILLFLRLRRVLGWGTVLLLSGLLTLSPIVTYYSRFARNDMYMTAWMIGMIVAVTLYLKTAKVRYLVETSFYLALTYCTKENSYVNNFALCSFLILWGAIRLLRLRGEAICEIFGRYLPLVRLLILFGCFSAFAFIYVAIDCRIGPQTPLFEGLGKIASHATSVKEKTDAKAFENEAGYFTAEGRESAKRTYFGAAFSTALLLLLLADAISFRMERRPWSRVALLLLMSLIFYGCLFYCILSTQFPANLEPGIFVNKLAVLLAIKTAFLFILSGLFPLVDRFGKRILELGPSPERESANGIGMSNAGERTLDGAEPEGGWRTRTLGLWGLIVQLAIAQALFLLLFSSVGTNLTKGIGDGLYGYLAYWFKHQTGDYRIWGTWWYYLPRLWLYELLPQAILLAGVAYLAWVAIRSRWGNSNGAVRNRKPEAYLSEPSDYWWKPVPLPFLLFSIYLFLFMVGVYAILNEKVAWLATYQAFAVNFLAAILAGYCFAVRICPRIVQDAKRIKNQRDARQADLPEPMRRPSAALILTGAVGALLLINTIGQHIAAVFVRPDRGSEIINYTATTGDFVREMRNIARLQSERRAEGRPLLRIAVDDTSEWPCVWYFRNEEVLWKSIDFSRDIQIMKDTGENRRRVEMRRDNAWEIKELNLRGWWIWHGDTKGLPGGLSLARNIQCFLKNTPNDHREVFPIETRPSPERYSKNFTSQVLHFVWGRRLWYPEAGEKTLVCYKTEAKPPHPHVENLLQGSDQAAQPLSAELSWGTKGSAQEQLLEPRGMAFLPSGNLAIADSKNGRIKIFTTAGEFVSEIGKDILSKEVSGACDLDADSEGFLYVADTWNHCIRKFDPSGKLVATANEAMQNNGKVGLFGPRGISLNSKGIIYVTDTGNKYVRVYSKDLNPLFSWGGEGEEPGHLNEPVGIAIDAEDKVYVADMGNGRIQRFTPEGSFEEEYAAVVARDLEIVAMEPHLAMLPDGRLVATYSHTGTLWIINPKERNVIIHRIAHPEIRLPQGIAVDRAGALWVSDRDSSIIGKIGLNLTEKP